MFCPKQEISFVLPLLHYVVCVTASITINQLRKTDEHNFGFCFLNHKSVCVRDGGSQHRWAFRLLTRLSLIFSTLVRKSSSRLVQASLWLSEVRAKKYATASLHTLHQKENQKCVVTRRENTERQNDPGKYELKYRKLLVIAVFVL